MICFHSRSASAEPGKGTGECACRLGNTDFLKSVPHFRRRLSNFDFEPFHCRGYIWPTVEHCFQAMKFIDCGINAHEVRTHFLQNIGSTGRAARMQRKWKIIPEDVIKTRWDPYAFDNMTFIHLCKVNYLKLEKPDCEFLKILRALHGAQLWHNPGHGLPKERFWSYEQAF
jgi:hypothetical protein